MARTFAILAAVVLLAGAANAQTYSSPVAAAQANRNLSTLVAGVQAAGLTSALNDPNANLTVLAPTNAAFSAAVTALGTTPSALLASSSLPTILKYHVIPGAAKAAALTNGATLTTLLGQTLKVSVANGKVTFVGPSNNATVSTADIAAGNSIVHVIDTVLLPNLAAAPAGAPASGPALATALATYTAGLAPAPSTSG